jgi:hypothetical protein
MTRRLVARQQRCDRVETAIAISAVGPTEKSFTAGIDVCYLG